MRVTADQALPLVVGPLLSYSRVSSEESSHRVPFARCLMGFESEVVPEPLVAVLTLDLEPALLAKLDPTHGQTQVKQVP